MQFLSKQQATGHRGTGMKYTAKPTTSGQWCVAKGSKAFSGPFTTQEEAQERAIIESMMFHQVQAQKLWGILSNGEDFVTLIGDDTPSQQGDFYC